MNRNWLIIPDFQNLHASCRIAREYSAAFEYNDFYYPDVYTDEIETKMRIDAYLSLNRDRSKDTLHGVFYDIAPLSNDPLIRKHSRALMRRSLEIGRRLSVRGVVFHSGLLNLKLKTYQNTWLRGMEELFREFTSAYPTITIFLENTTEQEPTLLVEMAKRMKDVKNFALCLDYAHASLTETPVEIWAKEMGPYVGHVHLNDNDLISDLHQVTGQGKIDFQKFAFLSEKYFPSVPIHLEIAGAERSEQALAYMQKVTPIEGVEAPLSLSVETLNEILDTTLSISRMTDKTALLNLILKRSMEISHADGGTLYVLENGALEFRIMKTLSLGIDRGGKGEPIDLPPVPLTESNVCAYSALHKEMINVPNVYTDERFDFSGPKKYDKMTGYTTASMLTIPLTDLHGDVLGVMQLLNAKDGDGGLIPFATGLERIIEILAAQAAITLQQMNYISEIRALLWSFTEALAEAIDQRTPYNGSHTRIVAKYAGLIADKTGEFDERRREQLVMAAYLHDIGKMVIPTAVMNKATRLGTKEEPLLHRLETLSLQMKIDLLEGKLSSEEYAEQTKKLEETKTLIQKANTAGFLNDELFASLQEAFTLPYFTEEEKTALSIRKGTLTEEERKIMESHVQITESILKKVRFGKDYALAPVFASQHHEYLNGKGYPRKLKGDELPLESKILAVADICDALLASDRPYKKALPKDKAFQILYSMADEGSLDRTLVSYLEQSLQGE